MLGDYELMERASILPLGLVIVLADVPIAALRFVPGQLQSRPALAVQCIFEIR